MGLLQRVAARRPSRRPQFSFHLRAALSVKRSRGGDHNYFHANVRFAA
jgi:hypothetical protein